MVLENATQERPESELVAGDLLKKDKQAGPAVTPTLTIDDHLEEVLLWAQKRFGNEEIVQAKEEFFWKMGKVFHDDSFYEQRMNYFLDYFLLERPVREKNELGLMNRTPIMILEDDETRTTSFPLLLSGYHHAIFEVKRHLTDSIVIIDLFSGDKFEVSARSNESFKLLQRKQVFQGFIYEVGDKRYLSRGLLFHPDRVIKIIKKTIKTVKKAKDFNPQRLLSNYAKHNLRYLRHSNLDSKRIYVEAL